MSVGWPRLRRAEAVRSLVFFGLLYLFVWLVVQPCLIYSCGTITNFPVFYKGGPFSRECLSYPGGLLRYFCALLPQFFYYSWAGALVITGQAWAICACAGWFLRLLAVPGWRLLRFIPAFLVLVAYAQYSYHFPTMTGALASLLFGCLYIGATSPGTAVRTTWAGRPCYDGTAYLALSVVSYVVSAAAYLPFAGLCAVCELFHRRRYVVGVVYLLVAAGLPYAIGVLLFHVSIGSAYTDMLPLSWQIRESPSRQKMIAVVYVLYLWPAALALVRGLWQSKVVGWVLNPRAKRAPKGQTRGLRKGPQTRNDAFGSPAHPTNGLIAPVLWWAVGSLTLFAVGTAVAVVSLDRPQRALLAVHYYACQRRWPEVLQAARHCAEHFAVINAVDRALYHTGRLSRDMFFYFQHPDALVLTGEDHSVLYWQKFDTLIDLGLVNLAEKDLAECVETFGEQPMLLQRLALVNLIKGKVEAARIYLERLRKTLFFSRWAEDYLTRLAADPTLAGDAQMQQWRGQSLRQDSVMAFFAVEPMLTALVEQGPEMGPPTQSVRVGEPNRMAFEYLMAWCLASKQLNKVAQNLGRVTTFGYTEVPPLYQEAALICASREKKAVAVPVSPETRQRMERFAGIYRKYGGNRDAAFSELAKEYGGSYFLYNVYGLGQAQK
jgi:hypothetical protein